MQTEKCGMENHEWKTRNGKTGSGKTMLPLIITSATEKTKTQAQNSSQKLKEKTQPQGGTFLLLRETQEKTQFY